MLQYLHGKRYDLVTLGRIKIRGFENTIAHKFQSSTLGSHSVYACILILMFQSHLSSCHISAPCQTVVVSIYIVKVLCLLKNALHSLDGALFLPVATFRCYYLDARIWFDGIHKTTMTLQSRRRAL